MRLIRGAPGSGRTALVFREFKAALAEGRTDLRIVVPTATLVRHFQHELARDLRVVPPGTVVSMNRFVRECAGDAASAPDSLVRLFVRDALRHLDPPEFAGVAGTDGMADVVLESIRLLENAGCGARDLASIRGLGQHAKALARVWADVDARVAARGFVSRGELFARAAANAPGTKIWLDGFVTLSPLERNLIWAIAPRCDIAITALDDPQDEVRRWALESGARDQLLRGLARVPAKVCVQASTVEREADEIVRRIAELRRSGTEYRDIGVAVRDIATYRPLLETALERFGVPARFYFSRPLSAHPAALLLGGLVDCALGGWSFEETLAALRAHPAWSTSAAFDRFDFAVREAMPARGSRELLALAQDKWPEDEWLKEKLEACFAIEAWTNQQRPPAAWKEQIESWANAMFRPGRPDEPGEARDFVRLRSLAHGLRAWLDALDEALLFWGGEAGRMPLAEFWRIAADAIEAKSVTETDNRSDAVHVMSALEARQWNLVALFICGLTDRDYPRQQTRHLLLTAADIEKLSRAGFRVRTLDEQESEERKLFASLASRATQSLVLTWPAHDAAGRAISPSEFAQESRPADAVLCAPMLTHVVRPAMRPARISSPGLLAELATRHATISTTHIESLAQCRFQFFARKTLGLEPRPERPNDRLGPREAGLILHETLELWLKDQTKDFADLFEEVFERACLERHLPRGYRLEVERFELRGIARAVRATQLWGIESSEAEVEVTLPLIDGVTMSGRVDRVDHIGGGNCIIVDYKSKGKEGMKRLVESETALQGPLYSLALRKNKGATPVGMFYWAVRDNELYGWSSVPVQGRKHVQPIPPDWENSALTRITARLNEFFAGDITPEPTHADVCRYCDARDCCRYEEKQALTMTGAANG